MHSFQPEKPVLSHEKQIFFFSPSLPENGKYYKVLYPGPSPPHNTSINLPGTRSRVSLSKSRSLTCTHGCHPLVPPVGVLLPMTTFFFIRPKTGLPMFFLAKKPFDLRPPLFSLASAGVHKEPRLNDPHTTDQPTYGK